MSLFTQSAKSVSAAVIEIADSAGVSADSDMRDRALRSLCAAHEYFNGRAKWEFTLTESDPISVFGPIAITGVTAVSGNASAAVPAGHGLQIDDLWFMGSVVAGTRLSATAAGGVGFNSTIASSFGVGPQVVTATAIRDAYALPSAWKAPYSARLQGVPSTLRLLRRRFYDRSITSEFTVTTPVAYDIFMIGGKGKIRLLGPPASDDSLLLRYYRRMTIPTATGQSDALDIPQDFEPYLIAWGKWHFLTDKGEGRAEQGQTWMTLAQEGIRTMLADQTTIPDEDLGFTPGAFTYNPASGPNQIRDTNWDY